MIYSGTFMTRQTHSVLTEHRNTLQRISPGPSHFYLLRNKDGLYGQNELAPRPNPSWKTTPYRLS
jgi:hypothetical protein